MIRNNKVKTLQSEGKPAFGTWITLCPHPRVVKILATSGFDFVIIEMEHTDFTMETVGTLAMYARECGIVPIVRPPGTMKPHDLTRPLDAGAQGLLLPAVETADAVPRDPSRHEVPSARQPPDEPARPAHRLLSRRAARDDRRISTTRRCSSSWSRSRHAIGNLDEILAVGGVDCVMIGPDDLSQDLGVPGEMQNPALLAAYEEIFAICRKRKVPYGLSAQSTGDGRATGCRRGAPGSPTRTMRPWC